MLPLSQPKKHTPAVKRFSHSREFGCGDYNIGLPPSRTACTHGSYTNGLRTSGWQRASVIGLRAPAIRLRQQPPGLPASPECLTLPWSINSTARAEARKLKPEALLILKPNPKPTPCPAKPRTRPSLRRRTPRAANLPPPGRKTPPSIGSLHITT